MKASGNFLRKALLWVGLPVLVILALLGLIFLKGVIPGRAAVHLGFAGWSIAVLSVSNRSRAPVMYFGDQHRQPRCDIIVVTSRQKLGNHEHITISNLAYRIWDGHMPMQLPPQASVDCLVPWLDEFTNSEITINYIAEPNLLRRIHERFALLLGRQADQAWDEAPLTGAPWTNAPAKR